MAQVDVLSIFTTIEKSLQHIVEKYGYVRHRDLLEVQRSFETEFNCKVIKLYSKNLCKQSKFTDVRYWDRLEFESETEMTMFLLKWT